MDFCCGEKGELIGFGLRPFPDGVPYNYGSYGSTEMARTGDLLVVYINSNNTYVQENKAEIYREVWNSDKLMLKHLALAKKKPTGIYRNVRHSGAVVPN